MRRALPLIVLYVAWMALCAYMIRDAYHPMIPCTTDSECMRLNGGDGSPTTDEE